jgi:competence protein ComEC
VLHLFEPATRAKGLDRIHRSPAVPVLFAVAAGILGDRMCSWPLQTWWLTGMGASLLALVCGGLRLRRISALALLVLCAGLGGAWHHCCWSCLPGNEISNWGTDKGRLVRLVGKVLQPPLFLKAMGEDDVPWRVPDRTLTVIECRSLIRGSEQTPASGRARLSIAGRLEGLAIGDVIEVSGVLGRPAEPSNPGEFHVRNWLRSQGLNVTLSVDNLEAIQTVGRERTILDQLAVLRGTLRARAENLISSNMGPRTGPVAQSLLLGSRVDLDRDLRRAFVESGTLHVLAISGMNVGLLWGWLWLVCRICRLSPRVSVTAALVLLPVYALITDANPPVVRATIVAEVMAFGQLIRRRTTQWNSLALAALLVLAWNPSDLFNAGAQLSFVAVCAILLTTGFVSSVRIAIERDDQPVSDHSLGWSLLNWFLRKIFESYLIGLGIWVMTSPLIASQFHVVSPIGILLNVLLSPLILVMFCLGYTFLLLGLIAPILFGWIGSLFEITLSWFLSIVEFAARLNLGHNYVPAPPMWWMIGFYLITLSLAVVDQRRGRFFWSARGALAWSVLGLFISLRPEKSNEVSIRVLSVGHGLSCLIELPNGRTVLYDAGSLLGASRAARTIEGVVWWSGKARLDAILVSHADADHCNAVAELVSVVPTRTLLAHRTFLDWTQAPVASAIEKSSAAGVTCRLVSAGQRIELDPLVQLTVLHPAVDFQSPTDNSNSIVLCLEYAGRRILFTGDLERDGLYRLLSKDRLDTDVLLSPHHGSIQANTPDLARWSTPEWLVVSCRDDAVRDRLEKSFGPETTILTTARHGAIRCVIQSDGQLRMEPFKE